ncbi:hypothetical protein V2A60_005004 [Cordyceps javanica]
MANITLAWMMDQMASVGVEFHAPSALRMIRLQIRQYEAKAAQVAAAGSTRGAAPQWAVDAIFRANAPVRPWGMGAIQKSASVVDWVTGRTTRTPGQYRRVDPGTGDDRRGPFLVDTNERVHSSARVRLACRGLDVNDKGEWKAATLAGWRLRRTATRYPDPVPRDPLWDPANHDAVARAVSPRADTTTADTTAAAAAGGEGGRKPNAEDGERWIWEYAGPDKDAPTDKRQRVLVEEPLGPYERFLLNQVGGTPNIYAFAEAKGTTGLPLASTKGPEQDSETETETPAVK